MARRIQELVGCCFCCCCCREKPLSSSGKAKEKDATAAPVAATSALWAVVTWAKVASAWSRTVETYVSGKGALHSSGSLRAASTSFFARETRALAAVIAPSTAFAVPLSRGRRDGESFVEEAEGGAEEKEEAAGSKGLGVALAVVALAEFAPSAGAVLLLLLLLLVLASGISEENSPRGFPSISHSRVLSSSALFVSSSFELRLASACEGPSVVVVVVVVVVVAVAAIVAVVVAVAS
mmetsp:Transcript_72782/g.146509  ORF Transcript_72782/g.146509 Transcript_72782/m.146509 type:complete len:237 (+) Transcript_72782:104-814(+)